MAIRTFNNGGGDGFWSTVANWIGGKPGLLDVGLLDGTSDANLTVDENFAVLSLESTSAYDGNIDFGDGFFCAYSSSGLVLAHTGNVDLGLGTTHRIIAGGDFDYEDVGGTFSCATSTVRFSTSGDLKGLANVALYNLTVDAGQTVTLTGASGRYIRTDNTVTIDGTLSLAAGFNLEPRSASSVDINTGGEISGGGYLYFNNSANGEGLTTLDGALSPARVYVARPRVGSVWAAGTWDADVYVSTTATHSWDLQTGACSFASLEFENTGTGTLTIDWSNNPTVTNLGTLRIDIDQAGATITVSPSSNALLQEGDVVNEVTAGTFDPGEQDITFEDTAAQNFDPCGTNRWGEVTVDKTAGGVTLDADLYCTEMDLDDGDWTVTAGVNLDISGDCIMDTGDTVSMGAGSTWTVDGNWDHADVTAFDDETSTLVMTGAGKTLTGGGWNAKYLYNVTINGTVTTGAGIRVAGTLTVNNTFTVDHFSAISGPGDLIMGVGSVLDGSNGLTLFEAADVTQQSGTISITALNFLGSHIGTVAAQYDAATVTFQNANAVNPKVFVFLAGTYTFSGDVVFERSRAGAYGISCVFNPDFVFQGSVAVTPTAGDPTWTKGTGTITLSGAGAGTQTFDWNGLAVEDIVVNDVGAIKQLTGNVITDSFTGTAGTLDTNGQDLTTASSGNFTISAGFQVVGSGLDGSTITVDGDLSLTGQNGDLLDFDAGVGNAATLTVNGSSATATYTQFRNIDASGGTTIIALKANGNSNLSGNQNIYFGGAEREYPRGVCRGVLSGAA